MVSQVLKIPIFRGLHVTTGSLETFQRSQKAVKMRLFSIMLSRIVIPFQILGIKKVSKKRPKGVGRVPEAHYTCHVPRSGCSASVTVRK